jgi:predicted chitinase
MAPADSDPSPDAGAPDALSLVAPPSAPPTVTLEVVVTREMLNRVCIPAFGRGVAADRALGVDRFLRLAEATSPPRAAAALAQAAFESDGFFFVKEQPSKYSGPNFEHYDPPGYAAMRLGNTDHGDGAKFPGRDFLQSTGRANARALTAWVRERFEGQAWPWVEVDFECDPERMIDPDCLGLASAHYWLSHPLNASADAVVAIDDFDDTTAWVNGGESARDWRWHHGGALTGLHGIDARRALYRAFRAALGLPPL